MIKLKRKIQHNEKVYYAQDLDPKPKVKVAIRSEVKILSSNNSKTTEANLMKLHIKIEHNEKVCHALDLGSYAQGQGNNQVRGLIAQE